MKHHIVIDDETMTVLRASSVSATSVKLPPGQLARPLYMKVNKVLETAGGIEIKYSALPTEENHANAALIAEMRNALPALLNSHAALVAALTWALQQLDAEDAFESNTYGAMATLHCTSAGYKTARAALATAEEKPRK